MDRMKWLNVKSAFFSWRRKKILMYIFFIENRLLLSNSSFLCPLFHFVPVCATCWMLSRKLVKMRKIYRIEIWLACVIYLLMSASFRNSICFFCLCVLYVCIFCFVDTNGASWKIGKSCNILLKKYISTIHEDYSGWS